MAFAFRTLKSFDPLRDRLDGDDGRATGMEHGDRAVGAALRDGAVRHSAVLDLLISHGSTVKPSKMERAVLAAARLGVLQYIRGVPPHAAVSESVALLPPGHRARGLINAVLRRATEMVTSRPLTPEERESWLGTATEDTAFSSPTRLVMQNRWLLESPQAIFPASADARLLLMSGVPAWLSEELLKGLDVREHRTVLLSAAEPPGVWFRVVSGSYASIESELAPFEPVPAPLPDSGIATGGFRVPPQQVPRLLASDLFRNGRVTVQDFAAQIPVTIARPQPGWKCIDFCAAPGGKTVQLATAVGPKGLVIACDSSEPRLMQVRENVGRTGLGNTRGVVADATNVTLPDCGTHDLVLADVPCSNTGVMGRRVEVKFRLRASDAAELRAIQLGILANSARHARSGGTVVYSTCSLLDSENGQLVRDFLEQQGGENSGWRMLDEALTLPQPGLHDGGYACLLRKP